MRRHVITGGLGSGKTSLVQALAADVVVVTEPARELISEHKSISGEMRLDQMPQVFVERLIDRSIEKYETTTGGSVAVFERGIPDCVAYAAVSGLDTRRAMRATERHRYESPVFLASPWKEIYTTDGMRKATWAQAETFYSEVVAAYERLGNQMVELPKTSIEERVAIVRAHLR